MEQKFLLLGVVIAALAGIILAGTYLQKPAAPSNHVLTTPEIKDELQRLETVNRYPDNMGINPKDYPRILGTHSNGRVLIEKYFCSDVCPNYGGIWIVFQNVTSKEGCAEIGGRDVIDPAWHGYIGCTPAVD